MSDLHIDTGRWPILNQSGASLPTAEESAPRAQVREPWTMNREGWISGKLTVNM